jgi:type IV pilus assembly protein PilO
VTLDELKLLDPKNIGGWPPVAKIGALLIIFFLILLAAYWFDWSNQWTSLQAAQAQEDALKQTFKEKVSFSVNLEGYKKRLKDIDVSLGALLRQLPNKSEMDALITDVNQAGLGRGLQFELFKPASQEIMRDFYAELPVNVRVSGTYHALGAFANDVAKLSRIVLLEDLNINAGKDKDAPLSMDATARTYRYLDEQEIAAQQKIVRDKAQKK